MPSEHAADDLVIIGRLLKPHGLRGDIRCHPETDYPERFEETDEVEIFDDKNPPRRVRVEHARMHGQVVLIKFEGIDTIEAAEPLRGFLVAVPDDETVDLEEGEFYHYEIEGLQVFDETGKSLGIVDEVLANPAHEIYRVGELLIPAVPEYVLEVDLDKARVVVRPPVYDDED